MPFVTSKPIESVRDKLSYGAIRRSLIGFGTRAGKRDIRLGAKTINVFPGEDIQKAINALDKDDGGIVFLKTGTHVLTGNISGKAKVSIIGEGRDITIIDCGSTTRGLDYTGTSGTILENFVLADFTLKDSNNTAGIDIDFCDFWRAENIKITSCDQKGIRIQHCQNFTLDKCNFDNNTGNNFDMFATTARIMRDFVVVGCNATDSGAVGFSINTDGVNTFFSSFVFTNCVAESNTGNGFDFVGNDSVEGTVVGCRSESNSGIGFDVESSSMNFVGCQALSNTGDGFEMRASNNALIACRAKSNAIDIDIANAGHVTVVGCEVTKGTSTQPSTVIDQSPSGQAAISTTLGSSPVTDRKLYEMKNNSGGS